MNQYIINSNNYLSSNTKAFFHVPYTRMGSPGNPDYLNDLKNTFNSFPETKLRSAVQELQNALREDLPQILDFLRLNALVVCVVPRAKSENSYGANQKLFCTTVQTVVRQLPGFVDGTSYLRRHTNTKTTHLRKEVPNYTNDGPEPYQGITAQTCDISPQVKDKNILLIDDIYTPGVNIDEDAIQTLRQAGANNVTFYSVGKVERY
jgi:predicted amidophosphoribosyltransferase